MKMKTNRINLHSVIYSEFDILQSHHIHMLKLECILQTISLFCQGKLCILKLSSISSLYFKYICVMNVFSNIHSLKLCVEVV